MSESKQKRIEHYVANYDARAIAAMLVSVEDDCEKKDTQISKLKREAKEAREG